MGQLQYTRYLLMYKLIACDLDETLIKPDRTIDSRDIEAIKKLKDLGVKFVLATGRGYNTVQGTLKELDLFDEANQYVISYNGVLSLKIRIIDFYILKVFLLKKLKNYISVD